MIIDFNRYNGGGGSGSGVTPELVQEQINSALTSYWESGETKDYVDGVVSGISLDGYYTSGETDAAIAQAVAPFYTSGETDEAIAQAVSGLATEQYVQDALSGVSLEGYWTSAETEEAIAEAVSGISLEGYATSGDMQSAFTLISETQQVAAAGLNQLEGRIDELSAATPSVDLSGYYTSAQTEDAISAATSGKADAANITANGARIFPTWNEQGIITGTTGNTFTEDRFYVNNKSFIFPHAGRDEKPDRIYAPLSAGTAGDILVSTGNGAPVWSAVTFPDVSNYVTSAQVETQIEAKNYVNSGDVKSQVEAYNYATVSQIPTVPTSNTAFTNDAGYITDAAIENLVTSAQVETQITSKGYATVSQIPTVPTSNTAFTNDAGYITSAAIANMVSSTYVSTIWRGTQSDYDAIVDKDPNTFYIIVNN